MDHVFLYDNNEDGGKHASGVQDFIDDGFVTWLIIDGGAFTGGMQASLLKTNDKQLHVLPCHVCTWYLLKGKRCGQSSRSSLMQHAAMHALTQLVIIVRNNSQSLFHKLILFLCAMVGTPLPRYPSYPATPLPHMVGCTDTPLPGCTDTCVLCSKQCINTV